MEIKTYYDDPWVVVSKIGYAYYIRIYAYFIVLAVCLLLFVHDLLISRPGPYWYWSLVLLVTGILGKIFYIGKIRKITIRPEHIVIDHESNGSEWIIDYTQITSDRTLSYIHTGRGGSRGGYRRQVIDLDDGRRIIYTDMKFENFDDLKNNIFRYMVAANQARVEE